MVKANRPEVKEKIYQFDSIGTAPSSMASIGYGGSALTANLAVGIPQGTGDNQRIGNRIKLIGVQFQFAVQPGDNSNYFRLMLLRPKTDLYGPGGAATIQNILSGIASSSTQWFAPVDTDRYIKYYDKIAYMHFAPAAIASGTSVDVPHRVRIFKKFIRLNAIMQWDQSGNLAKDVLLAAISDSAIAPNPGAVAGFIKLFYTDA